jgi:hypothetical protein
MIFDTELYATIALFISNNIRFNTTEAGQLSLYF